MKRAGMLVVLLRGVNFRFWPSLRSMAVLSSRAYERRSCAPAFITTKTAMLRRLILASLRVFWAKHHYT